VWSHSIDPFGIDGFWWNCYQPIRLLREPNGGLFYAFRGAMKVPPSAAERKIPFLVEPGPEVPYVIARLLQFPTMVAVIYQLRVGDTDAYPIVYYTSAELSNETRTNDWGINTYSFRGDQGYYEERTYPDAEDEYLFNLEPWIVQQRVQWIAPGDESLQVRKGIAGCPYLELPGQRAVWRTKEGKVWFGPPGKSK
jgi:hypothetical protein